MKKVKLANGSVKKYYEQGDLIITPDNKIHTVDSVDLNTKEIVTVNGVRIKLSTDIKPTYETRANATIIDKSVPVSVEKPKLYFAKTKPNAIIPTKRDEDAGYDIYTSETDTIVIFPCTTRLVATGIAIACDKNYFPKFFDKGGMGSKGIIIGAGVGDSGFRNEYFVPLINTNRGKFFIMTTQSEDEIAECDYFDFESNRFINSNIMTDEEKDVEGQYTAKENCIIKSINKAFAQFVMLPVPEFDIKEISWDELKAMPSERGLGMLGSTCK